MKSLTTVGSLVLATALCSGHAQGQEDRSSSPNGGGAGGYANNNNHPRDNGNPLFDRAPQQQRQRRLTGRVIIGRRRPEDLRSRYGKSEGEVATIRAAGRAEIAKGGRIVAEGSEELDYTVIEVGPPGSEQAYINRTPSYYSDSSSRITSSILWPQRRTTGRSIPIISGITARTF